MLKKVTYEYLFDAQDRDEVNEASELEIELMNTKINYRRIITPKNICITVMENWKETN